MRTQITAAQAAKARGCGKRRILVLLEAGRIQGAKLTGGIWLLPDDFKIKPPPRRPARKLAKLG